MKKNRKTRKTNIKSYTEKIVLIDLILIALFRHAIFKNKKEKKVIEQSRLKGNIDIVNK